MQYILVAIHRIRGKGTPVNSTLHQLRGRARPSLAWPFSCPRCETRCAMSAIGKVCSRMIKRKCTRSDGCDKSAGRRLLCPRASEKTNQYSLSGDRVEKKWDRHRQVVTWDFAAEAPAQPQGGIILLTSQAADSSFIMTRRQAARGGVTGRHSCPCPIPPLSMRFIPAHLFIMHASIAAGVSTPAPAPFLPSWRPTERTGCAWPRHGQPPG